MGSSGQSHMKDKKKSTTIGPIFEAKWSNWSIPNILMITVTYHYKRGMVAGKALSSYCLSAAD